MDVARNSLTRVKVGMALTTLASVALCGCGGWGGDEGSKVDASTQTISFAAAPTPAVDEATATVSATASSNLPVRYSSTTPAICSVDSSSGVVTGLASGTCTIAANQSGNSHYAPAAQVVQNVTFSLGRALSFAAIPTLAQFDRGTITAVDSSGHPVRYSSSTPLVCTINADSGLITALSAGDCSITATAEALQATEILPIAAPSAATVPGAPSGVAATLGDTSSSVKVGIGAVAGGGSPIIDFSVASTPPGITATGSAFPLTVTCPSSCAGYAFTVRASNAVGTGASSSPADVLSDFNQIETFHEPDTQPRDSIFVGTFTLNSTTGAVSNLKGRLSESMTGGSTAYPNDTMNWLSLENQLVSWRDSALGGTFAATFVNTNTNTFYTGMGGDGWSPQAGVGAGGIYFGFPKPADNPGNAYALIFVPDDPLAALTQAQIDKLAYADCAPGGMMGAVCMTGTSVAGYGAIGTMSGYPASLLLSRTK